jgi:hypothetical protein
MGIRSADLVKPFAWGFAIEEIEIGPYIVRAYHPRKEIDGGTMSDNDLSKIHYHGYIDGKDCNESWLTLDAALVGLIVRRNLGANYRQINEHFMAGLSALRSDT